MIGVLRPTREFFSHTSHFGLWLGLMAIDIKGTYICCGWHSNTQPSACEKNALSDCNNAEVKCIVMLCKSWKFHFQAHYASTLNDDWMHIKLLFLNQIIDDNCFTNIQKQLFSYRNILVPANLIDNYEGRDQSHFYIQHFRHIKHRAFTWPW